ncbi:hypothetical protein F5Y02DRAFT_403839 [Annulohypoxylon stygium]|nr:hypothetical protein F5Y02DRAFT_403839 [Annulohypoxylon stygium]
MAPAQAVLSCAELLDLILRNVPSHYLLPLQRVSRFWRSAIINTPFHRLHLFLDSPLSAPLPLASPTAERYARNEVLAFCLPEFFRMAFLHYLGIRHRLSDPFPAWVIPTRIASFIRDGQGLEWIAGRPQWEDMQVCTPPMTRVRWLITREDREKHRNEINALYCASADLEFPRGLRMGELWDLVSSLRGIVKMAWPTAREDRIYAPVAQQTAADQWIAETRYISDLDRVLVIEQRVTDERIRPWADDAEVNDGKHPVQGDFLFSGLPLDSIFRKYNIPVPEMCVLEDAPNGAPAPWEYNPVEGGEIELLTALAQTPFKI